MPVERRGPAGGIRSKERGRSGMIKPTISLQELRAKIGRRAKSDPTHRFWGLYVHLTKRETLEAAYLEAKRNGGAPGVDGQTFERIEEAGRAEFLVAVAEELRAGTYRPQPYRRREIPKEGGKVRVISIPSIRDRVVQGALRLLLEPLFEADFSDSSFGARPGRSAHEAVDAVRQGLRQRKHRVVDVDLKGFFDNIRHDRLLEKVARRLQDDQVLAMVKQFLKSTGDRGVPQGSPLSPLLANIALNDLDRALDRGRGFLTYVRYLDDMVVLTPDSQKGRRWADRALERIRREAEAIGVSLNAEKTRTVTMTERDAVFAFLGFDFRWKPSPKSGKWYPNTNPREKKVTQVLRGVRDVLRSSRDQPVRVAVARVNAVVRGWVNYFRVGNSSQAFDKVKDQVERKVRRFAAKKSKRGGLGWKRWSKEVVYGTWGLFDDYRITYYALLKAGGRSSGIITPAR
jgi:RNA-directed DNA polymerase